MLHRVTDRVPANITARHTFGGHSEIIIPENDGCLGSWNGGNFELEIESITGFFVTQADEKGEIVELPSDERGRRKRFTVSVPLFWSEKVGLLITRPPSNYVKLQESTKSSRVWEIAIITNETKFFLSIRPLR